MAADFGIRTDEHYRENGRASRRQSLPNLATPGRAKLSPKAREVVGLVTLVFPRFPREPVASADWWSVRLHLIIEPVPPTCRRVRALARPARLDALW